MYSCDSQVFSLKGGQILQVQSGCFIVVSVTCEKKKKRPIITYKR